MAGSSTVQSASHTARPGIAIDFTYLDLETCTRCKATDANLDIALNEVERILAFAGVDLTVNRMLVGSIEEARANGFVSSPTIRVNGNDIALELRESECADCGEACGCGGGIDCRVWVWQGQEYTEAPPAMIVDAILREVSGGAERPSAPAPASVPENLERFFAGKAVLATRSEGCCSDTEQAACCDPAEKASCCGSSSSGSCGCK